MAESFFENDDVDKDVDKDADCEDDEEEDDLSIVWLSWWLDGVSS